MDDREQRGLALAALYRIEQVDGKYIVPSQRGDGATYTVDPERRHCTCRDHEDRAVKCKHMFAVEFVIRRETAQDGTVTVEKTFTVREKVTYKQEWPAYNKAQTREKREFLCLLADLCRGIDAPARNKAPRRGRPTTPMADLVFAVAYKVYSTLSGRRFACDLEDAAEKGHIGKAPYFTTVMRGLEDEAITPVLKRLIVESSRPLASVERDFAVDSTGFSTCRFERWFDMKYGKTMTEREWVKVHVMTGVKTNVVTAVEILGKTAGDAPQLPGLLATTAETFDVREVSADAGYLSLDNVNAIAGVGATPFIACKENTTGAVGGLFAKMYHYFQFKQDEFLAHYHKRSNVESTFSMMKAKFGDSLRSKTDVAMVNETLCKILCHNICCLIQSVYELGITATFWGGDEANRGGGEAIAATGADESADLWAWV